MNKKFFTSPKIVKDICIPPIIIVSVIFVFLLIFSKDIIPSFGISLIIFIFLNIRTIIYFIIFHNAFGRVWLNSKNINNKFLSINWENLNSYTIYNPRYLEYNFLKGYRTYPSVIAFGEVKKGGFLRQNSRKCIMISVSSETLALLKEYGYEKSKGIQDLFNENSFDL